MLTATGVVPLTRANLWRPFDATLVPLRREKVELAAPLSQSTSGAVRDRVTSNLIKK